MIPTILFLHGDGSPVIRRNWLLPLNRELRDRGQETVADTDVVDPDYSGVFQRPPAGNGQVPRRWTPPDDATYARARDAYELRRARLETRLRSMFGEPESKFTAVPMPNTIPSFGVLWEHAAAYQDSDSARRAVWRLVLDALPRSGPLIIIGYSLGSVVAVDLLKRLAQGPGPQHAVECLITMGSPLGAISRLRANCGLRDSFPYDTVRSWVNVYDPRDLPTGGQGLRDHFDAVLDAPIRLPDRFLLADHRADAYASQPVVTDVILQTLIGQALDVTSSAPVAKRVKGSELVLLKMAYASSLQTAIPADEQKRRRRLSLARESLAEQASRATAELSRRETTEVPVVLTPVDFLRDPALHLRGLWSDEQLVPLAVSLATGWPVPPYASETQWESKERSVALLRTLNRIRTGEGSVTTKSRGSSANISDDEYATVILEGVRTGREVMGRKGSALPAALIVAGVVALAATGVGLVFAAPAGLAGAAAITSTLAAFGPGGMVGGMVSLAALTGAGSALAAAGMTGAATGAPTRIDARRQTFVNEMIIQSVAAADPESLRGSFAALVAVIHAQEEFGFPSVREPVRLASHDALAQLYAERELHKAVAPDGKPHKEFSSKISIVEKFLKWVESDERTQRAMRFPRLALEASPEALDVAQRELEQRAEDNHRQALEGEGDPE